MSTHAEVLEHVEGAGTLTFVRVWIALLGLTGCEIFLAYEQVGVMLMLSILVALSIIKAALIIAYFMHLKFERFSLFVTLFPMLVFCILLMTIFFLGDAVRLPFMRPGI
ncbi:MAG TPA: cytochrome C oxidase subunit IV family protein [Bryobacteraceae bacterium]|nr:cytochrome C oxidase subunit IV family protein [Bryobacteraceae bacterium]